MSYFDVIIFKLEQMKNSLNHGLMTANTIIKTPPLRHRRKLVPCFVDFCHYLV
nr:MAG TPA: hypothetical protein [Caudoviricetes sp.]